MTLSYLSSFNSFHSIQIKPKLSKPNCSLLQCHLEKGAPPPLCPTYMPLLYMPFEQIELFLALGPSHILLFLKPTSSH